MSVQDHLPSFLARSRFLQVFGLNSSSKGSTCLGLCFTFYLKVVHGHFSGWRRLLPCISFSLFVDLLFFFDLCLVHNWGSSLNKSFSSYEFNFGAKLSTKGARPTTENHSAKTNDGALKLMMGNLGPFVHKILAPPPFNSWKLSFFSNCLKGRCHFSTPGQIAQGFASKKLAGIQHPGSYHHKIYGPPLSGLVNR